MSHQDKLHEEPQQSEVEANQNAKDGQKQNRSGWQMQLNGMQPHSTHSYLHFATHSLPFIIHYSAHIW